jgi:hypothetical protein
MRAWPSGCKLIQGSNPSVVQSFDIRSVCK